MIGAINTLPKDIPNQSPKTAAGQSDNTARQAGSPHQARARPHTTGLPTITPKVVIPMLSATPDLTTIPYDTPSAVNGSTIRPSVTPSPTKKRTLKVQNEEENKSAQKDNISIDHAERADIAVQNLNELVFNILEAEDQLEPDTSGIVSKHAEDLFQPGFNSDTSHVLRPEVHNSLEDAITKVMNVDRLSEISVEHLLRVQKLCAASFVAAHDLDLTLPSSGDEDVVEQFTGRVQKADNSLRASKVLLKIMSEEREEKQLQSDDILQDLLANLRYIMDKCVLHVIETRSSMADSDFWTNRKERVSLLTTLLTRTGRVIRLLGDLVTKTELSETCVNSIESLATSLVFVENAPSEKEALLGIQKVENVRRHAMDLLAKTFLRYTNERTSIFREILSSLEKLPVTRQSARQYKVLDAKPIQLVSALIMQLIQTTSIRAVASTKSRDTNAMEDVKRDEETGSGSDEPRTASPPKQSQSRDDPTDTEHKYETLSEMVAPLYDGALENARYVAQYLVQRALTTTKTSDQPYRHLLDIFTEDFLCVLGLPGWPAAELMLRSLLMSFLSIIENEKSSVPAKNMALDLMTLMGAGIADLQTTVQRSLPTLEGASGSFSKLLMESIEDTRQNSAIDAQLLPGTGLYAAVIAYHQDEETNSLQTQSAKSQIMAQWAHNLISLNAQADDEGTSIVDAALMKRLRLWILQPGSVDLSRYECCRKLSCHLLTLNRNFVDVSAHESRLAYALVALNLPFCRAFQRIFTILLRSLSSTQAMTRSKAIKSIVQLLEKDPAILERSSNVLTYIINSTSDPSPMVRDSALGLIGKCVSLNPALQPDGCKTLIERSLDSATSVRRRALRLLQDVYPASKNKDVSMAIADAVLRRTVDTEESISDLARQIVEEMWFHPFHSSRSTLDVKQLTYHIVLTACHSEPMMSILGSLLPEIISSTNKNAEANRAFCKTIVLTLFEGIIDNDASLGVPSQQDLLQTLTAFGKCDPYLFSADQMTLLRPYIQNLRSTADLLMFRAVVVIYRNVLPVLPPLQHTFLQEVQDVLFLCIGKLPKVELGETAGCLWFIDGVLRNTERLVRMLLSVLVNLHGVNRAELVVESTKFGALKRYLMIAGHFGKACDLENHKSTFKAALTSSKSETVSGLIVDIIAPFASPDVHPEIRGLALEAMCLICQSSPKNFLKACVTTSFSAAFQESSPGLAFAIVSGVKDFYLSEEERSKTRTDAQMQSDKTGKDRLAKSMVLSDNDGAATSMAQHFLPHIIRLALSSYDDLALVCTEVIASTDRQGLVHPKETGPALVALETSPNETVAALAYKEHLALHSKHESVLESEYVTAVEQAFIYQRDTAKDIRGVDENQEPKLRLFFDVLKSGSVALRRKLLGKLCTRSLMDVNKIETPEYTKTHLQTVQFTLENLSTFEYSRIDEITAMLIATEKAFTTTGNAISRRIESFGISAVISDDEPSITGKAIDPDMLRHVAACSTALTMLWETRTHLRKAWGLQSLKVNGKAKAVSKDTSKAPNKATAYSSLVKEHLAQLAILMTSLDTHELMLERCTKFAEILAVDNELKIPSDEESETRLKTPEDEDDADMDGGGSVPGSATRGKKRKAGSAGGTPRKPRLGKRPSMSRKNSRARSRSRGLEDDDENGWD